MANTHLKNYNLNYFIFDNFDLSDSSKFDEKGCFLKEYENYEYGRPLGMQENILKLNESLEIKNVKLNLRTK